MKFFWTLIFLTLSFCATAQIEGKIPARPNPPRLVNDFTGTLTPSQVQALEHKLVAYDDSTSNQLAVVIVSSLEDYDISEYGLALGRAWGIGGAEFNNGILLLVAKDDRKLRIEVGYGLEGAIPDITAKHIIEDAITPHFKEENYYRGLDIGTDYIIRAAEGEYKAPANYGNRKKTKTGFGAILALIIFFVLMGAMKGGGGRSGGGTMSAAGWILGSLLSGSGRGGGFSGGGGGGWSGGGGGGFGGFGGGGFGGGGASGSW